jgi:hypothetical protein
MQHTTQPTSLDAELDDHRLFPHEPPATVDRIVEEGRLPYQLAGSEPEAALVHVTERYGLPNRVQVDALERLLAGGVSEGEIARAANLSMAKVRRLCLLMELDPTLRQALRDSRIKAPVAFTAAGLPADVQAELVAVFERDGQLTGTQVKQVRERMGAIDAETAAEGGDGPEDPADAVRRMLEQAAGGAAEDPAERVRRQAEELLQTLQHTSLPDELGARLAAVLEDIQRVPVA